MEEADQLGMFQDPKGDLVCRCGHAQTHHGGKQGRGGCTYGECECDRFTGSGAILPPTEPRARTTDPPTSHAAANSIRDPTRNQVAILHLLGACGPVTDETLVRAYDEAVKKGAVIVAGIPFPQQSPSGIRTRRKELTDVGWVLEHDKVVGDTGRQMIRWRVNGDDKKVSKILASRAHRGF